MNIEDILHSIEKQYRCEENVDESDILDTKKHIICKYGIVYERYPHMNSLGIIKTICLFKNQQTPFMNYILSLDTLTDTVL